MSPLAQPTLSRMTRESGLVVISINGELDSFGTQQINPAFSVALADRSVTAIVDLSGVPFMSSSALAMFLSHGQAMHRAGGKLVLAGPNPNMIDVLHLSGFDALFSIAPTLEEALAVLEPPKPDKKAPTDTPEKETPPDTPEPSEKS